MDPIMLTESHSTDQERTCRDFKEHYAQLLNELQVESNAPKPSTPGSLALRSTWQQHDIDTTFHCSTLADDEAALVLDSCTESKMQKKRQDKYVREQLESILKMMRMLILAKKDGYTLLIVTNNSENGENP